MRMLYSLLHYDKIYLYAKNLEQSKYQHLFETFQPISEDVGYDVIEVMIKLDQFLNYQMIIKNSYI